jgi:hypothetical protein
MSIANLRATAWASLALLCVGLIPLPGEAVAPKSKLTKHGLVLDGVAADNPVIYDND